MADQFSAIEMLLGDSSELDDPVKRKATAAALRRQNAMGVVGQLMGVQPTQMAGSTLIDNSQQSLKLALAKQNAAKEAAAAAARQQVEDQRAQANFDQRERGIEATRINQAATRAGSGPIIDTPGGKARVTPDNTITPITDAGGKQVPRDPIKPTENQNTLATYASRLEQNLPVMDGMLGKGYLPSEKDFAVVSLGVNPLVERVTMSPEGKNYYGAASQIINAIMRRESGAAISAGEWANANKRWLPQPGDPPELVQQKRANLARELEVLRSASGPAYVEPSQTSAAPSAATAPKGVEWERGPDGRPRQRKLQ